ncbi:MAG: aldolase/citrate lyase family protein, partial [Pseudomonadota bacterium]
IESSAAVDAAARLLDGAGAANLPIWVMIETPLGTLNVAEIAAHPRVACLVLGTNDLLNDLRAVATPDRLPLLTALSLAVAAARAHGKVVLDGVYNAFRDEAGFEAEAAQGRLLGMEGKTLIHPLQIAIANRVYAPNPAAIERARADLAAFDAALARGEGIAVVDGRMVENLHAAAARRLIAEADAIARIETAASDAASV